MNSKPSLRDRLVARNASRDEKPELLAIPAIGRIDREMVAAVNELARIAKAGDIAARDCLWCSLRARIDRVSWVLKPWPNSAGITGIWDRDDVRQESWVVFAELLQTWDGKVSFVPYLLARFSWRLRDRILRGIGKRQTQYGEIRVPEEMIDGILVAADDESPESVALARTLLEELLHRFMSGEELPGEFDAWLELINASDTDVLVSPGEHPRAARLGRQSNVA